MRITRILLATGLAVALCGCGGASQPSSTLFEGGITNPPSDADFVEVEELGTHELRPENHMQLGVIYRVGPTPPESIRNRVIDHENRLVTCYRNQLERDPSVRADVAAYGWLGYERALTDVGINLVGTGDDQFVACLRRALDRIPVPEAGDRVLTSVRIPLRFYTEPQ